MQQEQRLTSQPASASPGHWFSCPPDERVAGVHGGICSSVSEGPTQSSGCSSLRSTADPRLCGALLPCASVSILIELIPLQNPFVGAQANYAWTWLFLIMFVCCAAIYVTIDQLVPDLKLSRARIVAGSIATASSYLLIVISIGCCWVYPIPFGLVLGVLPFSQFSLFFLAAVGCERFQSDITLRHQLVRQIEMTFLQGVIAIVYPLFSAVYCNLPPEYKPFFVIVLPVIK